MWTDQGCQINYYLLHAVVRNGQIVEGCDAWLDCIVEPSNKWVWCKCSTLLPNINCCPGQMLLKQAFAGMCQKYFWLRVCHRKGFTGVIHRSDVLDALPDYTRHQNLQIGATNKGKAVSSIKFSLSGERRHDRPWDFSCVLWEMARVVNYRCCINAMVWISCEDKAPQCMLRWSYLAELNDIINFHRFLSFNYWYGWLENLSRCLFSAMSQSPGTCTMKASKTYPQSIPQNFVCGIKQDHKPCIFLRTPDTYFPNTFALRWTFRFATRCHWQCIYHGILCLAGSHPPFCLCKRTLRRTPL